jgi:hypothetical protein
MLAKFFEEGYDIKTNNGRSDARFHEQTAGAKFNSMFKEGSGHLNAEKDTNLYVQANVLLRAVGRFQRTFRARRRAKLYGHTETTSFAEAIVPFMKQAREMAAKTAEKRKVEEKYHTVDYSGNFSHDPTKEFMDDAMGYLVFSGLLNAHERKEGVPWASLNADDEEIAKRKADLRRAPARLRNRRQRR